MKRTSRNPYVERMHVVVTSRSEGVQIQVTNLAGQIAVQFISWDEFFADPTLNKEDKKDD